MNIGELAFTETPPQQWDELCKRHGDLFNTAEWHKVLVSGFGSRIIYCWDETTTSGVSITVFKAGPFRIGYLGFPVGGVLASSISLDIIDVLKRSKFPGKLHMIRIPVSPLDSGTNLPLGFNMTSETAIEKLQEWNPEGIEKIRRVINKKKSSPLQISDVTDSMQGGGIFRLYRDTIDRHHGSMRYTERYFNALVDLTIKDQRLRCLVARIDNLIVGFLAVACHGKSTYYLHGGFRQEFRRYYPSDILFLEAITWAKKQGMNSFNMMASPLAQSSLVRYKEKWGGVTKEQKIYELTLHSFQTLAFKASAKLYQSLF